MSSDKEDEEPKKTFVTYMAEGNMFYNKRIYSKALENYSTALQLQPDDRKCLYARSKCYLKMGQAENALKDAEASLKHKKKFAKGIYQKAEALYTMGDFEFALVFYYRGHKLRPELQDFRLGIEKAVEAIAAETGEASRADDQSQETPAREKTAKELLGELYTDKEYLEKLLKDKGLINGKTSTGESMKDIITSCISYLDTRTEFWRQHKIIYDPVRDERLQQKSLARASSPTDPTSYVLKSMKEIEAERTKGNTGNSLKKAQKLLKKVEAWPDQTLPNKLEVIGNLYSCIGNVQMELGIMDKALENHLKDLELAQQGKLKDSESRALDNIGGVYVRLNLYRQAIKFWEKKIPLIQSGLEKAWLFHELGHCYMELKHYAKARDYGIQSLCAADTSRDDKWQLNARMLVAEAETKLGNYESSVLHFEKALDLAERLQNNEVRDFIQMALQETGKQMFQSEPIDADCGPSEMIRST